MWLITLKQCQLLDPENEFKYAVMSTLQVRGDVQSRNMNAAADEQSDEITEEAGTNSLTSIHFIKLRVLTP